MNKRKFILFLTSIFILSIFNSISFSDTIEGWKGYGLFVLNIGKISIIEEDVNITLDDKIVRFEGQYIIKNDTKEDIKASLGIPDNSINKISMIDKATSLKWKKRTYDGINIEFNLESKVPQEAKWYVFTLNIKAGETRILNLSLDAAAEAEEENTYNLYYLGDRDKGYSNESKSTKAVIKLLEYKPYKIIQKEGFEADEIDESGEIKIAYKNNTIEAIYIKYQQVDSAIIERVQSSIYKKPKEIAYAYNTLDYERLIQLCNEYIEAPLDKAMELDQIKMVKAEALRRLLKTDEYLKLIKEIEMSKVYPERASVKIMYDQLMAYYESGDKNNVYNTAKWLYESGEETESFISQWLDVNGFKLPETVQPTITDINEAANKPKEQNENNANEFLAQINSFEYSWAAALAVGLLIGFIIGRISKRKRNDKNSMYLYRR